MKWREEPVEVEPPEADGIPGICPRLFRKSTRWILLRGVVVVSVFPTKMGRCDDFFFGGIKPVANPF